MQGVTGSSPVSPTIAHGTANLKLITLPTGAFDANCHIAWNETDRALLIDPGADADDILRTLAKNKLTPAGILCTHGHCDHISAVGEILAQFPNLPVVMAEQDVVWAFTPLNSIPPYYDAPTSKPATLRNTVFAAGTLNFTLLPTPGHSPGSVCFVSESDRAIFTGDTLFDGSIGRTDLPGGDMATMRRSLSRLLTLPDDYAVHPGHGDSTTIGAQRRTNPYLAAN